jgi:phage shock protein C
METPNPTPEVKKLYRSRTNKVLAGVCGGIAEYFNIDPVLVRLIAVAVTLASGIGPGLIAYLVAYFIIPERPIS